MSGSSKAVKLDENRMSKPAAAILSLYLPAPVTPNVIGDIVGRAPERGVLWDSDHQATMGF